MMTTMTMRRRRTDTIIATITQSERDRAPPIERQPRIRRVIDRHEAAPSRRHMDTRTVDLSTVTTMAVLSIISPKAIRRRHHLDDRPTRIETTRSATRPSTGARLPNKVSRQISSSSSLLVRRPKRPSRRRAMRRSRKQRINRAAATNQTDMSQPNRRPTIVNRMTNETTLAITTIEPPALIRRHHRPTRTTTTAAAAITTTNRRANTTRTIMAVVTTIVNSHIQASSIKRT